VDILYTYISHVFSFLISRKIILWIYIKFLQSCCKLLLNTTSFENYLKDLQPLEIFITQR
jgi:hypothetical protein